MSLRFFLFQEGRNIWTKLCQIQPPPPSSPPSLFVSKQRRISIFEGHKHCACVFYAIGGRLGGRGREGGGGGVNFQDCVWSLASPLVEKKDRDIFQHKKSRHAKFQPIQSNLENHIRNSHLGPACTEPFNCPRPCLDQHKKVHLYFSRDLLCPKPLISNHNIDNHW